MYLLFFLTQTIHRQYTLTRDVSSLQVRQWLWGVLFGFYQFICETCIWANDKTINGGISEQNPYTLSPFSFCLEPFSVPSTPLLPCLTIFYPPIRKLGRYTGMVSIWPCVQADIFWTSQPFATKLGVVVHLHEAEYPAKHDEGLYNEDMMVCTMSSALPILSQLDLMVDHHKLKCPVKIFGVL